ncbi:hypothetical protein Moror_12960 [Moniliophthora roreri MCA 2997]|uniref:Uncharacterized protein n=1 Tax=Moniliophthora roreri (strain MCA 2997) TaxID=1381753 RepID=V2XM58_MONRO|nr:hypothetical protein Moror_12960 [Moniliophthora roreri MCA 2997]
MSPNIDVEAAWVPRFGIVVFLDVAFLMSSTFTYGIYTILICLVVPILRNGQGNYKAKIVLSAVLTMFAISTFSVAFQAAHLFLGLKMVVVDQMKEPLDALKRKTYTAYVLGQALSPVSFLIGDSVVMWRSWALWSGRLKIVLVPIIFLLGTAASTFISWDYLGRHLSFQDIMVDDTPGCFVTTYGLSAATNVAATAAIGYKAWLYRNVAGQYSTQARMGKVISIILAFGGIYSLLWIIGVAIAAKSREGASLPLRILHYWIRGASRQAVVCTS